MDARKRKEFPAQSFRMKRSRGCETMTTENKNPMTETDVLAACLGEALADSPSSFGADQAKKATATAVTLMQVGKCDADTFTRVIARLGNHSALRQWAIAQGLLKQAPDALAVAVKAYLDKKDKALDEIA